VQFCFADHYEPYGGGADRAQAHARVRRWIEHYPEVAARHHDSFGNLPKHTFFYPAEEYEPALLEKLSTLCECGLADVEVHLHHDNAGKSVRTLLKYVSILHERHGLLRRDPVGGKICYGFIRGNWALNNFRPDGRWSGVDYEFDILVETGCYADLTMPSAPSDTQTRKIDSIYFARGRPGSRKSHDSGRNVRAGGWGERRAAADTGCADAQLGGSPIPLPAPHREREPSFDERPSPHRVGLWAGCAIGVQGAEEHVFVKVHTHGATERAMQTLFADDGALERQYRCDDEHTLRSLTAWEMYNAIHDLALGRKPHA
jgi:hypothetical protein